MSRPIARIAGEQEEAHEAGLDVRSLLSRRRDELERLVVVVNEDLRPGPRAGPPRPLYPDARRPRASRRAASAGSAGTATSRTSACQNENSSSPSIDDTRIGSDELAARKLVEVAANIVARPIRHLGHRTDPEHAADNGRVLEA
jgi:hypothetical protein